MPLQPTIDELLDRAVTAINRGDRATADALAGRVLAVDGGNSDAEELLATPDGYGEIRRLTVLFVDLVDSTALSARIEPEVYRTVVGRYRDEVLRIVRRYEGHVGSTKGDGLLAVFGHPKAHENDAHRAVQTGLDITREVTTLSKRVRERFGFDIAVRVGIHRGLVYLDIAQDDVYGLGANLAARICSLAEPGTVAVSSTIEQVVQRDFELEAQPPRPVKGVEGLIDYFRVIAERDMTGIFRGPLIGRARELAYLERCWAQAEAGTLTDPGVVLLGEGGIGKSRLAAAAVTMVEKSGGTVLGLIGSPFHSHVGLRPVRRLLERQHGIARGSDPAESLRKLEAAVAERAMDSAVVPLLAPVLGIAPHSGYQPATTNAGRLYDQIGGAVKDYLFSCLGSGPGLLLVEDVHWFDEDTIEVVQAVLADHPGRLLVIITGRQLPPLDGTTRNFNLKPLNDQEADELILTLHPELNFKARNTVRQRCDGIPLYIEEVVAKLKERPDEEGESDQVPDTLYETLIARLRPSTKALRVVEVAALIGSRVDPRMLSSVVDLDKREIDELLDELTRGRVFQQEGQHSWRFHHELLREVAAELSPPSVRRRLHSRIADALLDASAEGVPEWPLVAHHYQRAERFEEASSAYRRASSNARQRGALNEARTHLTRSLENIEQLPAEPSRDRHEVAVRLERGFLESAATGHASVKAAEEFEKCLQLIGSEPGDELYATLSALWSYYATRGDLDRATELVEALRALEGMPDWHRAANDAVLGVLTLFRGELYSARQALEATSAVVEAIGSPEIDGTWFAPNDPLAGLNSFVGFARFLQGDLAGAESAFELVERRCEKLQFPHGPFTLCYARSVEAMARTESGQFDIVGDLVEEVALRAGQHGFDEWTMISESNRVQLSARIALAGDECDPAVLQSHIAANTAVSELWRELDMKSFLCAYDALLARLLSAAGMPDEARDRVELALQMADETGMHWYDAELLRVRAHTFADDRTRHTELRAAIELAQKQGALAFELRAAADDFALCRRDSERAALVEVLHRFPTDQTWPELARARTLLG
ncbi:AAA family ATPase [soil metagenome]